MGLYIVSLGFYIGIGVYLVIFIRCDSFFLFRVLVRFVVQVGPATGKFGYETYLRPKP